MCYKVKILFYIEELTKKAHIPHDFVHDAGKTWVCNLFCSLPSTECLLLGYFPDVFWVTTVRRLDTSGVLWDICRDHEVKIKDVELSLCVVFSSPK